MKRGQGLTFRGRGLQPGAEPLCVPVVLLDLDHPLGAPELHEGAQLQDGAAEARRMVALVSLVLGVKITVCHFPHGERRRVRPLRASNESRLEGLFVFGRGGRKIQNREGGKTDEGATVVTKKD